MLLSLAQRGGIFCDRGVSRGGVTEPMTLLGEKVVEALVSKH